MNINYAILAFAVAVAVGCGLFLGLFSCGGYVSHKQVVNLLLAGSVVAALVYPLTLRHPALARLAAIGAIGASFVITTAAAASFYPAAPADWTDFLDGFMRALTNGPC